VQPCPKRGFKHSAAALRKPPTHWTGDQETDQGRERASIIIMKVFSQKGFSFCCLLIALLPLGSTEKGNVNSQFALLKVLLENF
jgi:hypothetical protein